MHNQNQPIHELAFRSFVRAYGLLRNQMEPYFGRFGVSGAQWGVLRSLQRAEDEGVRELRLSDLSRRLLVKPPSVTGIVARLRGMGLLEIAAAEDDRRAKLVRLSPQGRRLLRRALKNHSNQLGHMMSGLNRTQQKELHTLMELIAADLEHKDLAPSGSRPAAQNGGTGK